MRGSAALLVCVLSLLPAARAADSFEGIVSANLTDEAGAVAKMVFTVKGGITRADITQGAQSVSVIIDPAKHAQTLIVPQLSMYMTSAMPTAAAPAAEAAKQPVGALEKTSVTEKILGYDTVKYVSKTATTTTEIWISEELGNFPGVTPGTGMLGVLGPPVSAGLEWAELIKGKPMFPLRFVSKSNDGKNLGRMDVTTIEKKSLPDSTFAPPQGFQDIGAMMRGGIGGNLNRP